MTPNSKMSVQEKVAELESRIADLEKRQRPVDAYSRTTVRRVDIQPEMDGVWRSIDRLFTKVFGR